MHTRYLEDFAVGQTFDTRPVSLGESQVIDFALAYDPQPMHTDLAAAARGPFGGLIASGFHTLMLSFRTFIDLGLLVKSNIVGVGVDEVRWPAPVRPGDTLKTRVEVLDVRPSRSKPDRGAVQLGFTVTNQHGETVMTYKATPLLRVRPAEAERAAAARIP
jgi:acyl dehydratase